jgi:hypothetical protein
MQIEGLHLLDTLRRLEVTAGSAIVCLPKRLRIDLCDRSANPCGSQGRAAPTI